MAIHQKLGNTVLMITHDVDEAVLLSDRIVMMTNGPAARIGEVLDVPLARPRRRLELSANADLPQVPPARARIPLRAAQLRRGGLRACGCPATSPPSRSAISKASPPACRSRARRAAGGGASAGDGRADRSRCRRICARRTRPRGRRQARRAGEVQARAASVRRLWAAEGAGGQQRSRRSRADNFRWRYYGLFYVAPAQNSYMCRLRMPNGILKHWQFAGLADLAERYGGGYSHVTTRANLQIREIEPKNAVAMVEAIQDLGLCSRGSGADNIRNVTGTPTAGIDPQELIDTRPYAREWHFHILNERALYGLPRKFNVAFDGGGIIPVLEDTNDIGFQAVRGEGRLRRRARRLVPPDARRHHRPPGFRARDRRGRAAGRGDQGRRRGRARLHRPRRPHQPQQGAAEIRPRRARASRSSWRSSRRSSAASSPAFRAEALAPRPAFDRAAHIGVHPQKQDGLNWIGVVLPVGKLTAAQMRGLAGIARDARRRRYPPHGLAEPADLRRAGRQGRRGAGRGIEALGLVDQRDARSAPASSPAPAMSAAASPPPTPSATPRRSRAGARRASSSTGR